MNAPFVRPEGQNGGDAVPPLRRDPVGAARRPYRAAVGAFTVLLLLAGCSDRKNAVSGTIEVDEAHVGPRAGGRVEKILAWEGDRLHEGQVIVQLDASELRASAGIAADLLLPFGTVRLSYAVPLNPGDGNGDATLRDREERFQVSFGVDF